MERTEGFLNHNTGLLGRAVDDCRGDEIPLRRVDISPDRYFPALRFDIAEESLDSFVLHGVLERAVRDTLLGAISEVIAFDVLDQRLFELVKDCFVDVDSLQVQTDLQNVSSCPITLGFDM